MTLLAATACLVRQRTRRWIVAAATIAATACAAQTTDGERVDATGTRPPAPQWPNGTAADASAGDAAASADTGVNVAAADSGPLAADSGAATDAALDAPRMALAVGAIVITEVMYNPSGSEPFLEWFEVYNPGAAALSLGGVEVVDASGRTAVLGAATVLAPGAYGVLVRRALGANVPTSTVVGEYGFGLSASVGVQLVNSSVGTVILRSGNVAIAAAAYGRSGAGSAGASAQLRVPTGNPADPAAWCTALTTWPGSSADRGTPGAPSGCAAAN